jgi:CheY-like chemotaxis protein
MTHSSVPVSGRTAVELARLQLDAMAEFHLARRQAEHAAAAGAASREGRMDVDRRLEVVRVAHAALVERTEVQLRSSVELLHSALPCRAVVAHRNAWFTDRLRDGLDAAGVEVVAALDNGAEAVGVCVGEQPDLVVVEERLVMLTGAETVREVRRYVPHALIAAHVGYSDGEARMLEVGASTAYSRQVPPADVAADLVRLLARSLQPA